MNDHADSGPHDDAFADELAALDDALASGRRLGNGATPPELPDRLRRGLGALHALQQLRPVVRHDSKAIGEAAGKRSEPQHESRPDRVGRFRIIRELGRGGFGVVFLAHDPKLHRDVALKVPHTSALINDHLRERFRREAQAAAALNHPNIVPVYEIDENGPILTLVSAYCPGVTLADWIKRQPAQVPPIDAAQIVANLADAVEHAHSRGILHRDLKPANVMVISEHRVASSKSTSQDNPNSGETLLSAHSGLPTPMITDFGLAKLMDEPGGTTKTGAVLGTPAYMAPEQARGKGAIDTRADIYSLGTILYELLVGRPPFCGESDIDTLQMVCATEPVPPRRLRPKLPRDIETITLKCLDKDAHHRYQSASDLAADLRRFVNDEPIQARALGSIERVVKWAKRRPAIAGLVTAIVFVSLLGMSGVVWQWRQTVSALDESQRAHETTKAHLYLNNIARARHELQANHISRAERLLDESPPSIRGWEWHYLKQLCQTTLFTLRGNGSAVQSIAYSPDGQLIASGNGGWYNGRGGEINIWDADTGERLHSLKPDDETVFSVAFHPDSRRLATGSEGGKIRIWDARTGQLLNELLGHSRRVNSLAFSNDGKHLASGCSDFTCRVWSADTGQCLRRFLNHRAQIWGIAFHPDNRRVVTGDRSGIAHLWAIADGTVERSFSGYEDYRGVSLRSDGELLAFGCYSGQVLVFNLRQKEAPPIVHHPNAGPILSVAFTPNGSVAWASREGGVRIQDVYTGKDRYVFRGHDSWAYCVAMSPDGRRLATAAEDGVVRIFDATVVETPVRYMNDGAELPGIMFDADGKLLALGGLRRGATIWNADTAKIIATFPGESNPTAFAGSSDGRAFAWVTADGKLTCYDRASKSVAWLRDVEPGPVTGLAFAVDGNSLAWGGADGFIRIWDTATGNEIRKIGPHDTGVAGVAFHPDGKQLASADQNGEFCIWSLANGIAATRFVESSREDERSSSSDFDRDKPRQATITRLAFSPDGRRLAAANPRRPLEIWDISAGRVALILDWDAEGVSSAAWSADGRQLAIALGKRVKVWDASERSSAQRLVTSEANSKAWHRNEAQWGEERRDWFAADYHLSKLITTDASNAAIFARRGVARGYRAEQYSLPWSEVAADFVMATELNPNEPLPWYYRAVINLAAGDIQSYRSNCEAAVRIFESANYIHALNNISWTCCLAPNAVADPKCAASMAERALAMDANSTGLKGTLSATLYRAGQFAQAKKYLEEAIAGNNAGPNVWDCYFMAMILQRLDQRDKAREWLERGDRFVDGTALNQPPPGSSFTLPWHHRLEFGILRKEAHALIGNQ